MVKHSLLSDLTLLLLTNEVWGKVMLLLMSVILFMGWGSVSGLMFLPGRGWGVSVQGCVSLTETPQTETPLDRDSTGTVKSGQYTSYWNAFL